LDIRPISQARNAGGKEKKVSMVFEKFCTPSERQRDMSKFPRVQRLGERKGGKGEWEPIPRKFWTLEILLSSTLGRKRKRKSKADPSWSKKKSGENKTEGRTSRTIGKEKKREKKYLKRYSISRVRKLSFLLI